MSKQQKVQVEVKLENVRLSFPQLFEPDAMNKGDRPAYQADFIMTPDHESLAEVKKAIAKVAQAKWGDNYKKVLQQLKANERICLRNGGSKTSQDGDVLEGYEGNVFLRGRSYIQPTLVDKNPNKPVTEADGKLYSGCYVNAYVAIWAQSNEWGKRVNAQLQGVQFRAPGETFGGGKKADPSVFDTLEDEFESDEDADAGGLADVDLDDTEIDDIT